MNHKILPADPLRSYLAHKAAIDAAIQRVLDSGWYILGEEVAAFEDEFARYSGAANAVGVGSGTEALHIALRACGVGTGDFVVTVSHTAVATIAAIELAGATPILVDVDRDTFTMSPDRLDETLETFVKARGPDEASRIRAVVPVHLYGHAANMPAISAIANDRGLSVIEDCAQSHGAVVDGRMTGCWGEVAAYSFYPTKNLAALGDAGALLTDSAQLADTIRLLREYGWKKRYVSEVPGLNSRLDPIQAAVLRVKLKYLDEENRRRRQLAGCYRRHLSGLESIELPSEAENCRHVYHQYVIRTRNRDELRSFLEDHGVGTLIHYPVPVHLQPAYRGRFFATSLQETEKVCSEVLSLPINPELSESQVEEVASIIRAWAETLGVEG